MSGGNAKSAAFLAPKSAKTRGPAAGVADSSPFEAAKSPCCPCRRPRIPVLECLQASPPFRGASRRKNGHGALRRAVLIWTRVQTKQRPHKARRRFQQRKRRKRRFVGPQKSKKARPCCGCRRFPVCGPRRTGAGPRSPRLPTTPELRARVSWGKAAAVGSMSSPRKSSLSSSPHRAGATTWHARFPLYLGLL